MSRWRALLAGDFSRGQDRSPLSPRNPLDGNIGGFGGAEAALDFFCERAAIIEFDGGFARTEAEAAALSEVEAAFGSDGVRAVQASHAGLPEGHI
jgi:hypothetical protein